MKKPIINWIRIIFFVLIIFCSLLFMGCPDAGDSDDEPLLLIAQVDSDNHENSTAVLISLKKDDTDITDADVKVNDTTINWNGESGYYEGTIPSAISSGNVSISIDTENDRSISETSTMPGPPTNISNSGTNPAIAITISWDAPDPSPQYCMSVFIDSDSYISYEDIEATDTEYIISPDSLGADEAIAIDVISTNIEILTEKTYENGSYITLTNSDHLDFTTIDE
jgi:hypothetical protein